MKKINVVLVHGIGNQTSDWAMTLVSALKDQFRAAVKEIAGQDLAEQIDSVLIIQPVHWADIFQERQKRLRVVLDADAETRPKKVGGSWWVKLKIGFADAFKAIFKALQDWIATEFIGDIIGYLNPEAQRVVHTKLDDGLKLVADQSGYADSEKAPITFIAHSLGTVITTDYIYDKMKARRKEGKEGFHDRFVLTNLFTLGAPIALFSLRYGGPDVFQNPIRVEDESGRWINLYDRDDPVGMPLKTLNDAYKSVVFRDVHVESGSFGIAHMKYFEKPEILSIMTRKIAIDWLALNAAIPADKIKQLYQDYDQKISS